MPSHLADALSYAAMGFAIFPLKPGAKVPLIKGGNGVKDATTDRGQIEAWWREHPNANIGLACGPRFWVLDADYAGFFAEQPDGADTIAALQRRFGRLPFTVKQHTGGLGWQWFFAPDPRVKNGVKVLPGLDTRAAGGYVVAPPSLHPSGYTYRWIVPPDQDGRPLSVCGRGPGKGLRAYCRVPAGQSGRHAGPCRLQHRAPGGRWRHPSRRGPSGARGGRLPHAQQAKRRPWSQAEITWRVDRALTSGTRNPRSPEARP